MRGYWVLLVLILGVNGSIQDLFDQRHLNLFRRYYDKEQYMELRAVNDTETGMEITLQNRAAMNTRLRVLYTDAEGNPGLAETGRLWSGQTKSVRLPPGAQHIKLIVEKDLFFETWRVAYQGTVTKENECLRIVGVTLVSRIRACK